MSRSRGRKRPKEANPVSVAPSQARVEIGRFDDGPVRLYTDQGAQVFPTDLPPPTRLVDMPELTAPEPAVDAPSPEALEEIVLPDRLKRWLDRSTEGRMGDLTNALIEQGWTIHPATRRAYPPGAFAGAAEPAPDCPQVPLPDTLDNDRALGNLVAALRRAGPFTWERH